MCVSVPERGGAGWIGVEEKEGYHWIWNEPGIGGIKCDILKNKNHFYLWTQHYYRCICCAY